METLACGKQAYEKRSGFLGSKKVYLNQILVEADQLTLTFDDAVDRVRFDEITGIHRLERKGILILHLVKKKKRELFFDDLELMDQMFELVDEVYQAYAIGLIEKVGIDNVTFEFGTLDTKLENGTVTNGGGNKIPLKNLEVMGEIAGVGGNIYDLNGTNANGKNKSILIYPKRVYNFSLLIYILENFTDVQFHHEIPEGFSKDVTVDGINEMTKDEIKTLKITFGNHRTLENGVFKFIGKEEMLLEQIKGYEITKDSFNITGEKEKENGRTKSLFMSFSLKKSRNLDVLEAIVRRFASPVVHGNFSEVILFDDAGDIKEVFEQIDVEAVKKMTVEEIRQLKISFDSWNMLDKGVFTYQGKPLFSLEETTGYSIWGKNEKINHGVTGVSSRVKGRERSEWLTIAKKNARHLDVLEVIIDRFTDAIRDKHYQKPSNDKTYFLTVDSKSFKLYDSPDAPWIEFEEIDGMTVRGGMFLTIYFKSGIKYELDERNTVNYDRNHWDLLGNWHDYLQKMVDDLGVENVVIRFGEKIILKNGAFYSSTQKKINYSDAIDMRVERKWFNIQCEGYGMSSEEPMNLDLLSYIIFELGEGVQGYNRYFKPERLTDEKMIAFEKKHALTVNQERDLAFAAILTVTNYQSPRIFKLKKDALNLIGKVGFKHSWGIGNRESALHALDYLSSGLGHTPDAQRVYETMLNDTTAGAEIDAVLQSYQPSKEALDALVGQVYQDVYLANTYLSAKKHLLQLGYSEDELATITNFAAWDYGRTGYIARYVVQLGYLTEAEAWPYVEHAATQARLDYGSWREFVAAYILGRALGYGDSSGHIFKVLEFLLEDEASPFNRLKFNDE